MDGDTLVRCPFLPVSHFHDNLVASSLSSTVGSVVEFICTGDEILSGPSVLQCTTTGKWNGSVPTCLDENDVSSLPVSSATGSSTLVPTSSPAEAKVETVLIVLWVTGGLLLVTLVILITCILTTHKKRQRNGSETVSPRGQGNPRHGGVNPTFSNYDEIWTWIPVVTNNTDQCRNQNSASARENSASARENNATQTNRELMRNLRLPTYNEAVSVSPHGHRSANQRQNVAHRQNVRQAQTTVHSNIQRQSHDNHNSQSNAARLTQLPRTSMENNEIRSHALTGSDPSRCHIRVDTSTANSAEHHHYETIPADMDTPSNIRTNPENITRIRVTTSGTSALQQARDLVNQSSAHARRPQPSAPEYIQASGEPRRPTEGSTSRDSDLRLAVHANPSSEQFRGVHDSRAQVHRSTQNYHRSSYDFRHSEASVFEYYGNDRRRVRIDDPPPPYSIFREPSGQGRDATSGLMSSAAITPASLRTGFESQYF